jgi:protein-S-isoprenylcysteine O-methyltransferase Ste14
MQAESLEARNTGPVMLQRELVRQGNWLFRWRSYLPFLILPLAITSFRSSTWVNEAFGNSFEEAWDIVCYALALIGLALRVATVGFVPRGTSGRNAVKQNAEVLNTTGMYSVVRHPLYFANFIVFVAFVLLFKSLLLVLLMGLAYFLYYERIMMAEEKFLDDKYGNRYRAWAAKTPAFFPRLSGFVRPALPFSWRSALLREFHTFFLISAAFAIVEMLEAMLLEGQSFAEWLADEPIWPAVFVFSLLTYLVVRTIKKNTNWLKVRGR